MTCPHVPGPDFTIVARSEEILPSVVVSKALRCIVSQLSISQRRNTPHQSTCVRIDVSGVDHHGLRYCSPSRELTKVVQEELKTGFQNPGGHVMERQHTSPFIRAQKTLEALSNEILRTGERVNPVSKD